MGRPGRWIFRSAGSLVAGGLALAPLVTLGTGRLGSGLAVAAGATFLGVLLVALALAVGVASAAYRSVAG